MEDAIHEEAGLQASPDTESDGTLNLHFLASRVERKKFIEFFL
jgi:hypothetical protein